MKNLLATDSDEQGCWEVVSGAELYWRSWDDESVVYDSISGDTHLLNPLSTQILKYLQTQNASADELASHVADDLELECDSEFLGQVQHVLSNLRARGLIELVRK